MATISTPHHLLDQARRRFTPTLNTIPGMGSSTNGCGNGTGRSS